MGTRKVKLSTLVPAPKFGAAATLAGEDVRHDPNFDEGLEDTTADIDALDAAYYGLNQEAREVALRLAQQNAQLGELRAKELRAEELAAAEADFQQRLHSLAPRPVGAPKFGLGAPLTAISVPQPQEVSALTSNSEAQDANRGTVYLDLSALQAASEAYHRQYHALIAQLVTMEGQRTKAEELITQLLHYYRPLVSTNYAELFATLMVCAPKVLFYALRFSELRYYYLGEHNYIQEYQLFDRLIAEERRFEAKLEFYRKQQIDFFTQGWRSPTSSERATSELKPEELSLLEQYDKMDKRTAQARFLRTKLKEADLLPHVPTRNRYKRKVRMKTTEDYAMIERAKERERLLASGHPLPPELLSDLLQGDLEHPETGTIGVHSYLAAQKRNQARARQEQEQYFTPCDDETHEPMSLEQKLQAALERHNADVANNFGLGPEADFKSPFFGAGKARYEQDLERSLLRSLYNYVTHDEIEQALAHNQGPTEVQRPVITDDNINAIIAQLRHLARVRTYGPLDARYYHPAGEQERRRYQITRPYTFEHRRQIEELAAILERNDFGLRHDVLLLLSNVVRLKEIFGEEHKCYDLESYAGQGWFRLEEAERLCLIVYMGKNVTVRCAQGTADHELKLSAADVWQQVLYLEGLEFKVEASPPPEAKSEPGGPRLSGVLDSSEHSAEANSQRRRVNPRRPNVITPEMIDPNELCYLLL